MLAERGNSGGEGSSAALDEGDEVPGRVVEERHPLFGAVGVPVDHVRCRDELDAPGLELDEQIQRLPSRTRLTYTLEDVPPIADEPSSFPIEDLASQMTFIPYERLIADEGRVQPLLKDWDRAVDLIQGSVDWGYKSVRKNSAASVRQAKAAARGLKTEEERAAAFVDAMVGAELAEKLGR